MQFKLLYEVDAVKKLKKSNSLSQINTFLALSLATRLNGNDFSFYFGQNKRFIFIRV